MRSFACKILVLLLCAAMALSASGCSELFRPRDGAANVPTSAPATDAPATEVPATDAPATNAPATDAPATEAPSKAPATPSDYQSEIVDDAPCTVNLYGNRTKDPDAVHKADVDGNGAIAGLGYYAWQFVATTELEYMEFAVATWEKSNLSCHVAIYTWDTDLETTLAGQPLDEETVTGISDNSHVKYTFYEKLPAGEYLFVVSKPSSDFLTVYKIPYPNAGKYRYARFYVCNDGETGVAQEKVLPQAWLGYANTPAELTKEISPME